MTVHVEAEWDPRDPVGETRWVEEVAAAQGLYRLSSGAGDLLR